MSAFRFEAEHLRLTARNPSQMCISTLQAIEHGHIPWPMYVIGALLLVGAYLPPVSRPLTALPRQSGCPLRCCQEET